MKKFVSVILVVVMICALCLTGCSGKKFELQTYINNWAYYEDGREGDVIDAVVANLTFTSDKEYTYTETTVIAHVGAGRAVTSWTYSFKGTYTVGAEDKDEMTKEITLSAPTTGSMVMNGAMTTAQEDPEILQYSYPTSVVVNYGSNTFVGAEQ